MKKTLLLFMVIGLHISMFSQFTITDHDENVVENEQTLNFTTIGYPDSSFGFYVFNDTDAPIYMKASIEEIIGGDGSAMEFCFGLCYSGIQTNVAYPDGNGILINPGEHQPSPGDHIFLTDAQGLDFQSYRIKFFMVDDRGEQVGESYFVNYVYDEDLSVTNLFDNNKRIVENTVVANKLSLNLDTNASVQIFDVKGTLVGSFKASSSNSTLQLSKLPAGSYFVQIVTEDNKQETTKILVK